MTGTHVIANQDPAACRAEVEKFIKDKADVQLHWTTGYVPVGIAGNVANLTVIVSCIIFWECSEADWRSFLFSQKMKLQSNGVSA